MKDKKDRIQKLCEEIAERLYGKEYYELDLVSQAIVYDKAEEEWQDELADEYDRLKEMSEDE
jgi:hypothetical protein